MEGADSMSVKATYTCDNCGAVKGETNHWFAIHQMSTGFLGFSIMAFANSGLGAWHLCGEACVMAKVSQCLREISAAAAQVEERRDD
jgi:hypothetical protein